MEFVGTPEAPAAGLDPNLGELATVGGVNLGAGWAEGRRGADGTGALDCVAGGSLRCCGAAQGAGAGTTFTSEGFGVKPPLGFGVNLGGKDAGAGGSLGTAMISTWPLGAEDISRGAVDPGDIRDLKGSFFSMSSSMEDSESISSSMLFIFPRTCGSGTPVASPSSAMGGGGEGKTSSGAGGKGSSNGGGGSGKALVGEMPVSSPGGGGGGSGSSSASRGAAAGGISPTFPI